jgi:hypothetical protein
MLHIPAIYPLFADTRGLTYSIDCLRSGQDPYLVGSFDPWHRPYNYPPIWLDLRYLGVTSHSSILIGIILACMTIAALLLLVRAQTWIAAIVVFCAATSRIVLFAVERGNTDEMIFFLLVLGFFLIQRQSPKIRSFLKGTLVVLLTILKIFPIAASIVLTRNRKGALAALLTAVLSIAALAATTGHHLSQIMANTPQVFLLSFGSLPFFVATCNHVSHTLSGFVQHHEKIASLVALLIAILSISAGVSYREQLDWFLPPLDFDQARGCIAVAGLAIFCLAFLRGSSYEYRLIFLLGPLACLVEDLNKRISLRSLPAAIVLLIFLWKPTQMSLPFELLDGLVFATACAWLGTSLLDRLQIKDSTTTPSPEPATTPIHAHHSI